MAFDSCFSCLFLLSLAHSKCLFVNETTFLILWEISSFEGVSPDFSSIRSCNVLLISSKIGFSFSVKYPFGASEISYTFPSAVIMLSFLTFALEEVPPGVILIKWTRKKKIRKDTQNGK